MDPMTCPTGYTCSWDMYPSATPVPADWSGLLIALVLITFIVTVGLLIGMWIDYKLRAQRER